MPVTFTSLATTYSGPDTISDLALFISFDISGSMGWLADNGETKLKNLQDALVASLTTLRGMTYANLDIMLEAWSDFLPSSITKRGVTDSDFDDLIDFVNTRAAEGGTDFWFGVWDAPTFFSGAAEGMDHVILFCTDGVPTVAITNALSTLASIPEKSVYCFNIELTDLTYTAQLDNTSDDGVPVVSGGDPDAISSVIESVLNELTTVTNPVVTVTDLWPEREEYPQGVLNDPTIRAPVQDGKPLYRSGEEPIHRTWSFALRHLTAAKKEELQAFQEAVGIGTEPFTYTDVRPESSPGAGDGSAGTYTVQLASPMEFDLDDDGTAYRTEVFLNEYCG